jgi:hypothetical protein
MGCDMRNVILQKLVSAFSLRALAQLQKRGDGSTLVKGRSHVVCYDWVILPSHKEAYQDDKKPVKLLNAAVGEGGNTMSSDSRLVSVNESSIHNFIKEESHSIKLVSSVFEVAKETMVITEDMKYAILKKDNEKYYIKLEDYIKNDINGYLGNM